MRRLVKKYFKKNKVITIIFNLEFRKKYYYSNKPHRFLKSVGFNEFIYVFAKL